MDVQTHEFLFQVQCFGMACRVSCATPVLGPGMGFLGVGLASAMAGQAGLHCRHHFQTGQHPLKLPVTLAFRRHDLLLDACLGIALFKVSCSAPCMPAQYALNDQGQSHALHHL